MGDNSKEVGFVDKDRVLQMTAGQLRGYAKECGVSLAGCTDSEQWKERLLLHHEVQVGTHYNTDRAFACRYSASNTRDKLDQLFDSVLRAMRGMDPEVQKVMIDSTVRSDRAADHSSSTFSVEQEIVARRNCLTTTTCNVIVAGETKSGKSTFLNLLLGMEILPSDIFSCTSAVCVLRYSSTISAEIVYLDDSRLEAQFSGESEAFNWLKEHAAEQDLEKREKGCGIDTINVYLPALILQSGVSLVDTPGIGENKVLTDYTMDYVKRHRAAGYIYLIKTDNAGGVHDDTLLEFLRSILAFSQGENNSLSEEFDPTSAMFVCNRWDQVRPEEQREVVKANALAKLGMTWPKFQASQTFFLSSKNAQVHHRENRRYVTADFQQVLKGIKKVFNKASNNAVNHHYRWLKQLLHHSTTFLKTTLNQCSQTDEELRTKWRQVRHKLDTLQSRTSQTTAKLRKEVDKEIGRLCGVISEILKEKHIREELRDWTTHPSPPQSEFSTKERWREEMNVLIMRRITEKIDLELRHRGECELVQDKLTELTQSELKLVDDEIDSIRKDMTDSLNSSVSSAGSSAFDDSYEDHSALEMVRIYNGRKHNRLSNLTSVTGAFETRSARRLSEAQTMSNVPKIKFHKILKGVRGIWNFGTSSENYMTEKTDKILKVVSEHRDCLLQMAAKYHHRLDNFITEVDNSIPRFIASNTKMMEDLRSNRRAYLDRRRELVGVMENLEPIREMLRGFGSLYIQDVTADNINFALDQEQRRQSVTVSVAGRRSSTTSSLGISRDSGIGQSYSVRNSQGLWSSYRWGLVEIGDTQEHLIGRTYVQGLREDILIKEIARLRCLECKDLAPFLGMSHMDEESAVFLFMGDLSSARRYLARAFHEPSKSVPRILEGVLGGLSYLHMEGLVHMELSLDTIMVNISGEPKLCGACLPRRANFPPDSHLVNAEPFVCLSPEVLRGELYTAEDDCYSFGLVAWEMIRHEKPYYRQRNELSLKQFSDSVHPSTMLGLRSDERLVQELSENQALKTILHGCLLPARGLRLRMDPDLRDAVAALRSEPIVQSLSCTTRRIKMRMHKRGSSENSN